MWNLLKSVGVGLRLISADSTKKKDEEEENRILEILDAPDSGDDDSISNEGHNEIVTAICNYKSGYVTHFSDDGNGGMIDGLYYFDKKTAPSNIEIGDRVSYIAHRKSEDTVWVVKSVYLINNDEWERESKVVVDEDMWKEDMAQPEVKVAERSIVGKVVKREGRELFLQPGDYFCHLDKISTSFIPFEGDWVLLKSLVEVDNDDVDGCGKLLQIESLSPLRSLVNKGQVSHWESTINQGIINSKVVFTLDSCDLGFVPVVGDKVLYNAIESEQGTLVWRALRVVPMLEASKPRSKCKESYNEDGIKNDSVNIVDIKEDKPTCHNTTDVKEESKRDSELFKNKHGIQITNNCNFDDINVKSEMEIIIIVKNESRSKHHLLSASFKSARSLAQSQLKLISPYFKHSGCYQNKPFVIHEWSSVRFVFKVTPRFVGKTSELFVWKFKGFEIGRRININIVDNFISEIQDLKPKKMWKKHINVDAKMLLATRNGFIVPSEKQFRAAAFIPVKLGHFPVPKHLLEAAVGFEEEDRNRANMMRKIREVVPSFNETLCANNYKQRFHALLYLEEIETLICMRNYEMPRAHFHRQLDYLVLEVPGLAEKRPSLVCGDSVIVSNPCPVPDEKDLKYEGSIYKICKNEIWIKFNKAFHDDYNGADYSVVFSSNRISFRRFHQAVNVTYDHLSPDWLFPTCLKESGTQIDVYEDDGELVENSNQAGNIDKKLTDFCDRSMNKVSFNEHVFENICNSDDSITCSSPAFNKINDSVVGNGILNETSQNFELLDHKIDSSMDEKESECISSVLNSETSSLCLSFNNSENCINTSLKSSNHDYNKLSPLSGNDRNKSSAGIGTPRLSVAERLKMALESKNNINTASAGVGSVKSKTKSLLDQSLCKNDFRSESDSDNVKFEDNSNLQLKNFSNFHVGSNNSTPLSNKSLNLNKLLRIGTNDKNLNIVNNFTSDNEKIAMKTLEEVENSFRNSVCDKEAIGNGNSIVDSSNIDNLSFNGNVEIPAEKFKPRKEIENAVLNKRISDSTVISGSSIPFERIDEQNFISIKNKLMDTEINSFANNSAGKENLFKIGEQLVDSTDKNTSEECYTKGLSTIDSVKINWQTTGRNWNNKTQDQLCKLRSAPNSYKRKLRWFNQKLNYHQKEAIKNILKGEARPLPYIIFGPPGTGKTITLVETALQLLHLIPESRLLISTPSNSASNLIAERMLDLGLDLSGILVRLCSHNYLTDDNSNISDRLRPYCTTADVKVVEEELKGTIPQRQHKNCSSREILGRHRVTIGTCVALGILYNMGFPQGHFTHILIDEAGQATEPEILVPLAFLDEKYGQAILAGDPMQLGPIVHSRKAIDLGLQESLLSRFLHNFPYLRDVQSFPNTGGFDPRVITRLVNNYRSLPEILKLPSMMFYEGSLRPQVSEIDSEEARVLLKLKEELPVRDGIDGVAEKLPPAMIFHGVRGINYQEEDSPSWFNPQEIVQVIFYVNMFYKVGLTPDQIGVVTPYQKQVTKIRSCLDKLDIPLPKVGSVEEFQGQERMAIILSPVRSNQKFIVHDTKHALGFVSSGQRLNVALTRARAVLVVLGNPHLLNCDPYWRTVLRYCVDNKAYIGCDLPLELES